MYQHSRLGSAREKSPRHGPGGLRIADCFASVDYFERNDIPAAHDAEPVLKPGPLVHQDIRIPAEVAKSFIDELT